jgi:hypothetical protein
MATVHHFVICKYCGERFDREAEPAVLVSARRYAHEKCAEKIENEKSQEQKDIEALDKYIMNLFHIDCISAKIKKQIKTYIEEYHYTYTGILKTLIYWFDIKNNSIDKANGGIGIVPWAYGSAMEYYYNMYLAQTANKDKDIKNYKTNVRNIEIAPPQTTTKRIKLFNLDDEGEV